MISQEMSEIKVHVVLVMPWRQFKLLKLDSKSNMEEILVNYLFNNFFHAIICRKVVGGAGPYLMGSSPRMAILLKNHVLHIQEERKEDHVVIFNLVNHMLELVTVTILIIIIMVQLKNKFKKNF